MVQGGIVDMRYLHGLPRGYMDSARTVLLRDISYHAYLTGGKLCGVGFPRPDPEGHPSLYASLDDTVTIHY